MNISKAMSKIRKNFFSTTRSVVKKSARIILCTLLIGLVFTMGCEKLKDLRERIQDTIPNDPGRDTLDFSNIEDLYAKPLPIIQECVHGKWKVLRISRWGALGLIFPTNTFIDIDIANEEVVLTGDISFVQNGHLNNSFSYSWETKAVYPWGIGQRSPCYTTFVMQNNDQDIEGWYFDKIINDTLHVVVDYHHDKSDCEAYLFLRIEDNNP